MGFHLLLIVYVVYIFNKACLITGQLPIPHTNIFAPSLTLYLNVHSNYEIHLSLSPSLSTCLTVGLLVGQSGRRSVSSVCHRDYSQRCLYNKIKLYIQKVLNDFNVYDSLKHTFESLLTYLIKDGEQQ